MDATMMMTIEFTFIGWWGWLMLSPLFGTQTQENDDDDS